MCALRSGYLAFVVAPQPNRRPRLARPGPIADQRSSVGSTPSRRTARKREAMSNAAAHATRATVDAARLGRDPMPRSSTALGSPSRSNVKELGSGAEAVR
mmetsp:Transcript_1623/g.4305  ORF Transcript_1623/g.4305 Transcript_1623/m.4305 type:complete len:100 (-) Transcript_1623:620-919(-)